MSREVTAVKQGAVHGTEVLTRGFVELGGAVPATDRPLPPNSPLDPRAREFQVFLETCVMVVYSMRANSLQGVDPQRNTELAQLLTEALMKMRATIARTSNLEYYQAIALPYVRAVEDVWYFSRAFSMRNILWAMWGLTTTAASIMIGIGGVYWLIIVVLMLVSGRTRAEAVNVFDLLLLAVSEAVEMLVSGVELGTAAASWFPFITSTGVLGTIVAPLAALMLEIRPDALFTWMTNATTASMNAAVACSFVWIAVSSALAVVIYLCRQVPVFGTGLWWFSTRVFVHTTRIYSGDRREIEKAHAAFSALVE